MTGDAAGGLSADRLVRLLGPHPLWTDVRVVDEVASTNTVLAQRARAGAAEGAVLLAGRQSAGRGRLGREWVSAPGSLALSVLLRPQPPPATWPLLALLAGVAAAQALLDAAGLPVSLKWPNDLLAGTAQQKLGGILVESTGSAVVIGIGLNVDAPPDTLPPAATSVRVEARRRVAPEDVGAHLLRRLAERYRGWSAAQGAANALLDDYRRVSATLGREVRLLLPGGTLVEGTATDVAADGSLLVREPSGRTRRWSSGDVEHVR